MSDKAKPRWAPGPWKRSTSPDYFDGGAVVVRNEEGFVVAVLTKLHGLQEEHAALIAAAPELYEALSLAHDLLAIEHYDWDNNPTEEMKIICAALDAALGEGGEK